MNEQLKRIREKDYSAIDQKLFENMTRTDNISSTLSHLSQFQKFLMEQITTLNQTSKVSPTSTIANNISRNFECLKESLVKCSRVINQNDRKSIVNLKKALNSLQGLVKILQKDISQQIKDTYQKIEEQSKQSFEKIINLYSKEKAVKTEYLNKCQNLQEQNARLLKQNLQLKQLNERLIKSQSQQFVSNRTSFDTVGFRTIMNTENNVSDLNQMQSSFTPLKQQIYTRNVNLPSYIDKSWKITKQQLYSQEKQTPNISRNNSNHRLNTKSNMSVSKQNELLLRKGVKEERGKSRQKIKLVSMM